MNLDDWMARARNVQQGIARIGLSGPNAMALALVELAAVLDAIPIDFLKAHEIIAEADLARLREEAEHRYVRDDFSTVLPVTLPR